MPYADADFFLAILKPEDWLKEKALLLYHKYKGSIWTSDWTVIEILLIIKKFGIDPERLAIDIFSISKVEGVERDIIISIAHLMKTYNLGVFDALHAVSCGHNKIISSDSVFDKIGLERIKLED